MVDINKGGNEMIRRPKLGTPCRDCGDTTRQLSFHGLCDSCGMRRQLDAFQQIRDKQGPIYDKWAARLIASTLRSANRG